MNSALKEKNIEKKPVRKSGNSIEAVVIDLKQYLNEAREDFQLLSFVKRYEKIKRGKRKVRVKVARALNTFLLSFPYYWQVNIKRYIDLISAVIALCLFGPIMIVVAIAVKITSAGPVIYKQERVGENGKAFIIYKFRTMSTNAEKESGPMWAKENDPRLTNIGRFLRKSHLDELPQLFNVLKGDMSMVGPRPERPHFVRQLKETIPCYEHRLNVKPGITGLAQVRHKYDETVEDVKKKVKYDLIYIKKMCLMLDLRVIMWTIGVVLTGKGAR